MTRLSTLRRALEAATPKAKEEKFGENLAQLIVRKLHARRNPAPGSRQVPPKQEVTPIPVEVHVPERPPPSGVPLTVTAAGLTLLARPTRGRRLRLRYLQLSNKGDAAVTVDLRWHKTGRRLFPTHLAAGGGTMNANLVDANVQGPAGAPLYVNLSAASTEGVEVMVLYDEV